MGWQQNTAFDWAKSYKASGPFKEFKCIIVYVCNETEAFYQYLREAAL